jgi:phosphate transport system protein
MAIFDEELVRLNGLVLQMGSLVEMAIKNSVQSIVERDNELARKVIDGDHQVNTLDIEIDEESIRLIALRQPKAGDLRLITTAMKITADLERMGDLAVNIAQRAIELNKEPVLKEYIDIPRMREIAQGMTFVKRDMKLAKDVIMRDDEIDDLKHKILSELLFLMTENSSIICRAMRVTFVAQYLERIADHATNMAEMVLYLIEGKIIRHTSKLP